MATGSSLLGRGPKLAKGIQVGSSTVVKAITAGTVAIDPGSIAATTKSEVSVTITGVAVGDHISMNPPTGMNDDILFVGAYVSAANTVKVMLYNTTAGAIDDGSVDWTYLWFDLT